MDEYDDEYKYSDRSPIEDLEDRIELLHYDQQERIERLEEKIDEIKNMWKIGKIGEIILKSILFIILYASLKIIGWVD